MSAGCQYLCTIYTIYSHLQNKHEQDDPKPFKAKAVARLSLSRSSTCTRPKDSVIWITRADLSASTFISPPPFACFVSPKLNLGRS